MTSIHMGKQLDAKKMHVDLPFFMSGTEKSINNKIDKACDFNNTNNEKCEDEAEYAIDAGDAAEDKADMAVDQGQVASADGEDQQSDTVSDTSEGDSERSEVEDIGAMGAEIGERMVAADEECMTGKDELLEQMQAAMDEMVAEGEVVAANNEEIDSLTAEIEEMNAAGGGDSYSTDMAAAGGENSAYNLSNMGAPAQAPAPAQARGAKPQGGLLSSGNNAGAPQANQPAQGAQGNQGAQGAQGGGNDLQSKLARLAALQDANVTAQENIDTAAQTAIETQVVYAESAQAIFDEAAAAQETGEEALTQLENENNMYQTLQVASQATVLTGKGVEKLGGVLNKTGDATEVAGNTEIVAGTTTDGVGTVEVSTGGTVSSTGFGAAAGAGLIGEGVATKVGAAATKVEGGVTIGEGAATKAEGGITTTIGKGMQSAGKAGMATAAAGMAITAAKNGDWQSAINYSAQTAENAMQCVNDTQAFVDSVTEAKDGYDAAAQTGIDTAQNSAQGGGSKGSGALSNGGSKPLVSNKTMQTVNQFGSIASSFAGGVQNGGDFGSGLQSAVTSAYGMYGNSSANNTQGSNGTQSSGQGNANGTALTPQDKAQAKAKYGHAAEIDNCQTKAQLDALIDKYKSQTAQG